MDDEGPTPASTHVTITSPNYRGGGTPPYGCWHIDKYYADGSHWMIGTVDGRLEYGVARAVADILAAALGIRVQGEATAHDSASEAAAQ